MLDLVLKGLWETIYMTVGATVLAYIVGLPLGLVLAATAADASGPTGASTSCSGPSSTSCAACLPHPALHRHPRDPLRRRHGHRHEGDHRAAVHLRLSLCGEAVESSAREVDRGVVEASLSMGASVGQVIRKVILPEALPSLINGAAIATTTILGYSAMAGVAGGGGLGAIAINYGYSRYNTAVMLTMCAVIVVVVQCFQSAGTLRKAQRPAHQITEF